MKILRNMIKCNHCGDIIESEYTHDFKNCKCGRVSIDGGHEYMKRSFVDIGDFTDLSVYENDEEDEEGENA